MILSALMQGRNNNFNLIRIVAALAVLITHCFTITTGTAAAEPLRATLGMSLGDIAVDVFFITSGFLVTASLLNRQNIIEFAWARMLRILPALWVMLMLTVFCFGVFLTTLPISTYLAEGQTYKYLLHGATLIRGVEMTLPGVFENNPHHSVNAPLWTMPHEVMLYITLALMWLVLSVAKNSRLQLLQTIIVLCCVFSGIALIIRAVNLHDEVIFNKRFFTFFAGAALFVLKSHIQLSPKYFWLLLSAVCLSVTLNQAVFFTLYMFAIPYILIYLVYVPAGRIRKYNQLGDYSYGVYIYAFLIQQSIEVLMPGVSPLTMFLLATPIALLFAVASWHLIEQRALALKGLYIGHTRRIMHV